MFSTLKKLGHKRKLNRKAKGKDKKSHEMLSSSDKLKSTARSSIDLYSDPTPPINPARRHSCFSAFIDVPTERLRRASTVSQVSSCSGVSRCRRSSTGSNASTASAESYRVKRLAEIAQLDRYVENLKKSADPDNMSLIPNRLCVALLLKSVLQRRERQYMYDFLHSNRCSSESDISMKSQRESPNLKRDLDLTVNDVNNNNDDNDNNNNNSNNNNNNSVDETNATAGDTGKSRLSRQRKISQVLEWKSDYLFQDLHSKNIDINEEDERKGDNDGNSDDSGEEVQEERVPGALLKAYQLELSGHTFDSDSEIEVSKHHRYKKRSDSKTRRKSIALYPQNYEIY